METHEVQNDGRETRKGRKGPKGQKGRKGRKHVSVNAAYKSGELFPHVAGKSAAFDQTVHRGCSMKKFVSTHNLLCIVRSKQDKKFNKVGAGDRQGTQLVCIHNFVLQNLKPSVRTCHLHTNSLPNVHSQATSEKLFTICQSYTY
jgi:hypothetical protein